MKDKKVLIIGSGGREHALAWKMAQSEHVESIYIAPGNAGTASIGENVPIAIDDIKKLVSFAKKEEVDLVVIGPDDALAAGMSDAFHDAGLHVFGPTKAATEIESSKAHAKNLMKSARIPTASHKSFTEIKKAKAYISSHALPVVVKASGLALGKGVLICETADEALQAIDSIMSEKKFGDAGSEIVIEEFMVGDEISLHAITDSKTHHLFPTTQDHKQIGEGGTGLNTGGMGVIGPVPWVTAKDIDIVDKKIVSPILAKMRTAKTPFAGCLYPGLMMTTDGPKVVEFNARFGDPEAEVYMKLMDSDLYEALHACATGALDTVDIAWKSGTAACIIMASGGYPKAYEKGRHITGIEEAELDEDIAIFHCGTKMDGDELVTNGGRVLAVTAYAENLSRALKKAYGAVEKIHFEGMYYRKDIGKKTLER